MWVGNFIFLCLNSKHSECEYGKDVSSTDLILWFASGKNIYPRKAQIVWTQFLLGDWHPMVK